MVSKYRDTISLTAEENTNTFAAMQNVYILGGPLPPGVLSVSPHPHAHSRNVSSTSNAHPDPMPVHHPLQVHVPQNLPHNGIGNPLVRLDTSISVFGNPDNNMAAGSLHLHPQPQPQPHPYSTQSQSHSLLTHSHPHHEQVQLHANGLALHHAQAATASPFASQHAVLFSSQPPPPPPHLANDGYLSSSYATQHQQTPILLHPHYQHTPQASASVDLHEQQQQLGLILTHQHQQQQQQQQQQRALLFCTDPENHGASPYGKSLGINGVGVEAAVAVTAEPGGGKPYPSQYVLEDGTGATIKMQTGLPPLHRSPHLHGYPTHGAHHEHTHEHAHVHPSLPPTPTHLPFDGGILIPEMPPLHGGNSIVSAQSHQQQQQLAFQVAAMGTSSALQSTTASKQITPPRLSSNTCGGDGGSDDDGRNKMQNGSGNKAPKRNAQSILDGTWDPVAYQKRTRDLYALQQSTATSNRITSTKDGDSDGKNEKKTPQRNAQSILDGTWDPVKDQIFKDEIQNESHNESSLSSSSENENKGPQRTAQSILDGTWDPVGDRKRAGNFYTYVTPVEDEVKTPKKKMKKRQMRKVVEKET